MNRSTRLSGILAQLDDGYTSNESSSAVDEQPAPPVAWIDRTRRAQIRARRETIRFALQAGNESGARQLIEDFPELAPEFPQLVRPS